MSRASTTSTGIQGTGFEKVDDTPKYRLVVAIDGKEKEGKSHFALTAPGPIAVINTDLGLDGVVQKFSTDKMIIQSSYAVDYDPGEKTASVIGEADDKWLALRRDYLGALEAGIRTLIVDTATEAWELLRLARFGKLSQVMPHQYTPVNAEFRYLINRAFEFNSNVILIHKLKPVWVEGSDGKGRKTGKFERAGFNDTGYIAHVNCRSYRDKDNEFHLSIENCRQNPELAGMDLETPMNSFPFLASMVFEGTDPSDWE